METLVLENNKLTIIKSNWFKCLGNLQFLDLDSNEITSIDDDAFDKLIKLERLDLRSNKFNIMIKLLINIVRNFNYLIKNFNKIRTESQSMYCLYLGLCVRIMKMIIYKLLI